MTRQRRLGRGLEALLSRPGNTEGASETAAPQAVDRERTVDEGQLVWLNVYEIDRNPYQPRQDFDAAGIQTLAESIKAHGMLQPVVVRLSEDRYQLISGERRLRAAIAAGWSEVPAQVRRANERQVAELAIVENLQRKDLNPLEKAASFQKYLEEYGCTQEELAARVKIDRSTVANLIRLLELPDSVQDAVRQGSISQGHARALLPLGDEDKQVEFCRRIQSESLSVRATEEIVQSTLRRTDSEPLAVIRDDGQSATQPRTRSQQLASLEQELRSALGTKVDIRQSSRNRGRIIVHFKNIQEFERLRTHLTSGQHSGDHGQVG